MNTPRNKRKRIPNDFRWDDIDTVLLDMDGTLLDKHFDDYFWEHFVPQVYAEKNGLAQDRAKDELMARYRSVRNTLMWSDVDFWSEQLNLDIPRLKSRIDHLIKVHPYVIDFLHFLKKEKKEIILVTAAHRKTLHIKMQKTTLSPLFDRIVCAEELGFPKESPVFWEKLEHNLGFDRTRTLLADDTAKVLRAAQSHGLKHLVFIAKPSSTIPVRFSDEFPSIVYFNELL